jgi:hypothetical protein
VNGELVKIFVGRKKERLDKGKQLQFLLELEDKRIGEEKNWLWLTDNGHPQH